MEITEEIEDMKVLLTNFENQKQIFNSDWYNQHYWWNWTENFNQQTLLIYDIEESKSADLAMHTQTHTYIHTDRWQTKYGPLVI